MNILLTGGGTAGSVTPLLAVSKELKKTEPDIQFLWIGTFFGPEKNLVNQEEIPFAPIFSGKLRRYFSWRNFVDPFFIIVGFLQSLYIVYKYKPDLIVSAGGFVSVPIAYAGWLFRKKVITHQLDIDQGLANKLISKIANKITVSFPESVENFPEHKVELIGTPIREILFSGDRLRAQTALGLDSALPTIVVLGGGTGALSLNKIIISSLPELLNFCQVIHITGHGKSLPTFALKEKQSLYHPFEFVVEELPNIYAAADVVISRAGIGTLTELAALSKATVVVPLSKSQQESNARYFADHRAVIVFNQPELSAQTFTEELRELLMDKEAVRYLEHKIHKFFYPQAARRLTEIILSFKPSEHVD